MKNKKRVGPDGIVVEMIKQTPESTKTYLDHIYNYTWLQKSYQKKNGEKNSTCLHLK